MKELLVITCVLLLGSCASMNEDIVWDKVAQSHPDCQRPEIVYVGREMAGEGTLVKLSGFYQPRTNTVFLSFRDADRDTLEHEYLHACEGALGEGYRMAELR